MKTHRFMIRTVSAAVVVMAVACSSSKEVTRGDAQVRGPKVESNTPTAQDGKGEKPNGPAAKSRMPEINARAKLYFDDALKAFDAQKRARKFDFPSLERKFQTALDA